MKIINDVFSKLKQAKSIEDVTCILNELSIEEKYHMDEKSYPQIQFVISKDEIEKLRREELLTEDFLVGDVSNQNALTKLLYSIIWKNGDLKKVRHIIEGIVSDDSNSKNKALVFHQFGKHLANKESEPIIDQHVLRSFGIYKALKNNNQQEIERLSLLSVVTKKEIDIINCYKKWLNDGLNAELRSCKNYMYHVDKVLFAIGKKVKSERIKA